MRKNGILKTCILEKKNCTPNQHYTKGFLNNNLSNETQ